VDEGYEPGGGFSSSHRRDLRDGVTSTSTGGIRSRELRAGHGMSAEAETVTTQATNVAPKREDVKERSCALDILSLLANIAHVEDNEEPN